MSHAKIDTRPEGSVELQAALYAEWNRALFIAQLASLAGHNIIIDYGSHKSMKGLALQTIKVGA